MHILTGTMRIFYAIALKPINIKVSRINILLNTDTLLLYYYRGVCRPAIQPSASLLKPVYLYREIIILRKSISTPVKIAIRREKYRRVSKALFGI